MIRPANAEDARQICGIYNYYVENTRVTFEEQPVSLEDMEQRIAETSRSLPWLVYQEGQQVAGYAYASPWKGRCAYRYSVESTVYLHREAVGRGIGSRLYRDLIHRIWAAGFHTIIGGIALPNVPSQRLHEGLGFTPVGVFTEVGFKHNSWIDVGYWQLTRPE
ncbi:arsinothricin resistance N-acetyltransferase ArsN1 family B [Spirochaeta lutea]|uniref:Phosphinothricin acetyltransferase n=1 Tax=Spirochaeta lutea TaxID=1480694 RepID=A0A098QSM9_9SPIO|nr:arsinothricin resistance N-acetyltransferase ArsN1 family B [Spirochaeta lutea]KGE70845.1 phosphinothricin acetyltransferase [Spirochaeta lutea]